VLRKAAHVLLGEDESAIPDNVELPLVARDIGGRDAVRIQLGRETRGPIVIARSGRAVVDLDRHAETLPVSGAGSRVAPWSG
jgi:hypothetical protein